MSKQTMCLCELCKINVSECYTLVKVDNLPMAQCSFCKRKGDHYEFTAKRKYPVRPAVTTRDTHAHYREPFRES